MKYKVVRGIENKKRRDEPGDTIKDGDYSKKTIKAWLESGVILEIGKGSDNGDREE